MMGHVRKIEWTADGWPVVMSERYTGVPQTEITDSRIPGTYEVITMNFQYHVLQTSKKMIL